MGMTWTVQDLEYWDARIREKVEQFGLDCFAQEFEICDHEQMLGFMAYQGMPSHYPHWSYGKSFEKLKTMYDYGVSGLPYEMVINASPSLAYLMQDNSLCLQVLTIAHVYGHNDFFKNNFMFRDTHPEQAIGQFKLRADRVRSYVEDPSIGRSKVEGVLDAAHALAFNCTRNIALRRLSGEEQRDRALAASQPPHDPYESLHVRVKYEQPDLTRTPLEPEENLLQFIAEHNPYLEDWAKDILHIVHEETQYFVPQIETKIMNEGWASFWHHRIMNSLDLPEDLYLEFLVHHNQVIRPHVGEINPYHLGFRIWHDILRRYDAPTRAEIDKYGQPEKTGMEKIFEVRETDRDASFLRRFLTEELMRDLDIFKFERQNNNVVVTEVADEDHWGSVKASLLRNTGMAALPVIRVVDADHLHHRVLFLEHDHDGRDLQREYLERSLEHLHHLWGRKVMLRSAVRNEPVTYSYDASGLAVVRG